MNRPRFFNPLFQHLSTSRRQPLVLYSVYQINDLKKDGYGIGLSLVSHVCDLCGGFAMVESEKNEGATFYLSFPQQ